MIVDVSVITAGPRGNKCKSCEKKTKAPNLILKAQGEYCRYASYKVEDKYCPKCGVKAIEEAIKRLKHLKLVLTNGVADEPVSIKRKVL